MKRLFGTILLALVMCTISGIAMADQLVLPENLTAIEAEGFYGDTSLDEVVLPESIVSLGDRAFAYSSIKQINLPASLKQFGEDVFIGVEGLKVTATEGTDAYAWADRLGLIDHTTPATDFIFETIDETTCKIVGYVGEGGSITLPTESDDGLQVVMVESYAFKDCKTITEVVIPPSIQLINHFAFEGCSEVRKLYIPSGVQLAAYAFKSMAGLKEVTLPVDICTTWSFQDVSSVETIHYLKGETGVMPDWWTADRADVYYEGDYRGRLEFYSSSSLKTITFEEGITRIGNYAYYGYNVHGGAYAFALEHISLPSTLQNIGKYAFNYLSCVKNIKIPDRCTSIGEGNFLNCENLVVIVGRFNHEVRLYCANNLIPYAIGGPLEIKVYQGYSYRTNEAGEDEKCLYLLGSASGGVKPYRYKFTVIENGNSTDTGWQDKGWAYLTLPDTLDFSVRAEVIDAEGSYACSDDVAGEAEHVSEKTYKEIMFDEFASLANDATEPSTLRGAIFNEGLPETQWLINLAADVLHADLSVFQTPVNKQKYLFKVALDAAADGKAITLTNFTAMPSPVKNLITVGSVDNDAYFAGLESLVNQDGGSVASYSEGIKSILSGFKHMKVDSSEVDSYVAGLGLPSGMESTVAQNIKLIGIISALKDAYGNITFAVDSFTEILNELYLLNSMDMNQLDVIATIYKDSEDETVRLVGLRLQSIIDAETYEERAALIAGGTLGILSLDKILDMFSLTNAPVFKLVYAAVDYTLGAGSYSKYMSELTWACDTLTASRTGLIDLRTDFTERPSDYRFELLLDRYITYVELCAAIEDAYVNVCNIESALTKPDYVTKAAEEAASKAEMFRDFADSLRELKALWNAQNYKEMIVQIQSCANIQEYLNNYAYWSQQHGGGW